MDKEKILWVFDNDGTLYDDSVASKKFMDILIMHKNGKILR